jgi:hypothetical protein
LRQRLAVAGPPEYNGIRDNLAWANHAARTLVTGGLIAWAAPDTLCDPACGDASILEAAFRLRPFGSASLADISALQVDSLAPSFPHTRKRAELMTTLDMLDRVDMIVLTEILEHLVDPDATLRLARQKAGMLVASSPIGDPENGGNIEHLWAWDENGYGEMLKEAGWEEVLRSTVTMPGINGNAQIWICR